MNEYELFGALCDGDKKLLWKPSAVIFSAHADDETLGACSLLKMLSSNINIVTVTDGSPRDMYDADNAGFNSRNAYSKARFEELKQALHCINIDWSTCVQLGFTDQETSCNMPGLTLKIKDILTRIQPDLVLTHAFDGGHPDHDTTAFAVWAASELLKKEGAKVPSVYEYALYHGDGGSASMLFDFLPYPNNRIWAVELNKADECKKREMIGYFRTQKQTISRFPLGVEYYRKAPLYNFANAPHSGVLLYEFYEWGMSRKQWLDFSRSTIALLGLGDPQ